RVVPVVEALAQRFNIWISVDTSKALVMSESAKAGAHLINDIRALQEPGALESVAKSGLSVCLMHMKGQPRTMQDAPHYENLLIEVNQFFTEQIERCAMAG
ncbi:dihydropteroate synthase, partial [Enterobacter hormaechei]|nr:dihydropteroate synthase [Enterobacter hormaechei]